MTRKAWLPDEIALAGREHLDPRCVQRYDRKAGVDARGDVEELRGFGLDADATLLDLGAGTGSFAVAAAEVCARVVAVDISPAMVAVVARTVAERGIRNVDCVQAGFLTYEHTGTPVDLIYTRNALHHLPDLWKGVALHRMRELLRPGGVLRLRDLVFGFGPDEADRSVGRWLDAAADDPRYGWTREELEMHLRDEYSTFTWLLEPMIERAGFEIVRAEYGELRVHADYICRRPGR